MFNFLDNHSLINNILNISLFNASVFFCYYLQKKKEKIKIEKKDPYLMYENKYKKKYDKLASKDLDDKFLSSLTNCMIIENTPKGNVLMTYNFKDELFRYYSDTKDIPYHYLETVSRKYVIQFNCKKIYINMKDYMKTSEEIQEKNRKNKNSLFVDYKINKNPSSKQLIKEKSNRYSYCGKINVFKMLKQHLKKKELTFADFKKFNNT